MSCHFRCLGAGLLPPEGQTPELAYALSLAIHSPSPMALCFLVVLICIWTTINNEHPLDYTVILQHKHTPNMTAALSNKSSDK